MKTVCFTGVRPNKLCGYNKEAYADFVASLTDSLEDFYNKGVRTYISGGAQGFDQLAAWAVENLQKRHSDVKNVIYVPFKGQERLWKENGIFGQAQYRGILKRANEVKYLADELTDTKEIVSAMHVRNHAMVDKADAVIALFPYKEIGDTKGGTVATMKYALSKDKSIYRVDYEVSDKVVLKGVEKFTNQQDALVDEVHDDISDSKKVFVSGSIAVKEIPDSVKEVLDSHIESGDTFLVGDASGVDSLIQRYLNDKEYSNVIVYHSGSKIRNKINPDWQDKAIYVPKGVSGRDFYTAKDEAMTKDCDEGIAIWDGKSVGTKANIDRLSKQGKSCFTYNQKTLERTENPDDDYIDSSKYFEFSD